MGQDEYKKKISLLNTRNDNEYYIRLDSYLDYILSNKDEYKNKTLIKIENKLNLVNDPLLDKLNQYTNLFDLN
jgi:hypothetical protein